MNGNKTLLYIGFVLTFIGFFVLLNSYWLLKSDVKVNQEKINQLQQIIDKQSKPCQPEDLLYPDRSAGCTIPSSTTAPVDTGTAVTPSAPQATTPQAAPQSTTIINTPASPSTPSSPPAQAPPATPPQSMIPGDQEPIIGCIFGICI